MAQIYNFNTSLLSAAKLGTPTIIGASLSGSGVGIVSLSSNDLGVVFNRNASLNGIYATATVEGSVFNIDTSYNQANAQMALLKTNGTYTIFQFASAGTVGVALSANYRDVTTPRTRRKRLYGYC